MMFRLNKGGVKLGTIRKKIFKKTKKMTRAMRQTLAQLTLTGLALSMIIPVGVYAQADKEIALLPFSVVDTQVRFDTSQPMPLVLPEAKTIAFTVGESKAQEETRLALARKKQEEAARVAVQTQALTTQSRVTRSTDPGFEAKRALAQRAAAHYNIPWQVLEAVWQIETGKSWDTQVRSYAGAQGPAQFMPATWRAYGVDANGDGVANIHSAEDAVYSAANYLAANGANRGEIRRALFAYNHANWYVEKVLRVAREIGYNG